MLPKHVEESILEWRNKRAEATFYERIVLMQEAVDKYKDEPYAVRYSFILQHILRHMTVCINPDEQIVGRVKEIIPNKDQRAYAERLSTQWWGDHVTEEEKQRRISYYFSPGWIKRRNPVFFSLGHLSYDWKTIITQGLGWYETKTQELLDAGAFIDSEKQTSFLQGALLGYKAHSVFISRYADTAETMAAEISNHEQRQRLSKIARVCRKIASGPAESFQEALQLIWFLVLVSQKVAGCGVFCFARMDQYLFPYFKRDLAAGRLTEDAAYALITEFYNKNNEIMFPTDHMSQEKESTIMNLEVTYDDPNYLIVGGRLSNGSSGVNRLSSLFIRASHEMGLKNPFVVVRWHKGINSQFWVEVCDAMRANATIVVYNDETMIPALQEFCIDEQDAYEYGFYGCNDPLIPAKEGGLRQLWVNLVWPLELALNAGMPFCCSDGSLESNFSLKDRLTGLMTGLYYGDGEHSNPDPATMDEFIQQYRLQMQFLLDQYLKLMEQDYLLEAKFNQGHMRIEDLFLDGTLDHAQTWIIGGVKYHKITMQGSGLATVIDSLAAINRAVYRDRRYTLEQLRTALAHDFIGHEEMRRYLLKLPKFGNDIDEVDAYAKVVVDAFADAVHRMNDRRTKLYTYMPTISTDRDFSIMGQSLAATANGRCAGDPVSENQSPTLGADRQGLTALLNSVSHIPFNRITGGPLNLRLHPTHIEGSEGLGKLSALLAVYMEKGGMQVQINVVGREQLLEAQTQPERYNNLCVRVTGYSAYFVQMGKIAQDELINRTEY